RPPRAPRSWSPAPRRAPRGCAWRVMAEPHRNLPTGRSMGKCATRLDARRDRRTKRVITAGPIDLADALRSELEPHRAVELGAVHTRAAAGETFERAGAR